MTSDNHIRFFKTINAVILAIAKKRQDRRLQY